QLRRALEAARTTNNLYQQIRVLLQLSTVARFTGQTDEAKQLATEAIDLARTNEIENLTTQGLIDLGNVFYARGQTGEAEGYFKQALEFARQNKGRRNEARALLSLASLHIQQEDPDGALQYIEQAMPFYRQGGYRKETSQALTLLGQANVLKGNYQEARSTYEQKLQLAQQVNDPSEIASSQMQIGNVLARQELYPEALRYFTESYAIYNSQRNQLNNGYALMNQAEMQWQLGHYHEANALLAQAFSIAEQPEGSFKQLLPQTYVISSKILLSQRRFPEAEAEGRKALALAGGQDRRTIAEAKYTLGMAYGLSGAARDGRQLCEEAFEMAKGAADQWLLSAALLALSETMLESRDAQGALDAALQAQGVFSRTGQQESEWRALLAAGRASQLLKDDVAARDHLARATSLLSSLQQKWGAEEFNGYLTRPDIQSYHKQLNQLSIQAQSEHSNNSNRKEK
nr:tetratricopeptide repeat protein [Acidobacteriota bacterium]